MKRRAFAEFMGTFFVVFAGTTAAVVSSLAPQALPHVGVAWVFGLVVLASIHAFGDISGAHLNPAVSLGFALARRFPWSELPVYVFAQTTGALVASIFVRGLFGNVGRLGATVPHGTLLQSLGLEILLTFILFLVILRVSTGAREKGITAGIAIGAVIGLEALLGGPVSGASMNPARSYGPALVAMDLRALSSLWIYCIGPVLGAALAVPVSQILDPDNASPRSP